MELCTSGGSEGNLAFWRMEKNYKQYLEREDGKEDMLINTDILFLWYK